LFEHLCTLGSSRVVTPAPVHAGIVYGLYLTLSSWVLFYVATHMSFFKDKCNLADLNTTDGVLVPYCEVGHVSLDHPAPCHWCT
jgi:hypothetical protein